MQETTLVIMAAGIGSRFGKGIKQLAKVGPSGELIMDYSIHDALEAGFNRIVFIIRKDIEDEFYETIGRKVETKAPVNYIFQEMDDLPGGFSVPEGRKKPWGTGQAILCCDGIVNTPFVVINADDYYGKEPYKKLHDQIIKKSRSKKEIARICMAGFYLGNTLSENGGVTRGICTTDKKGLLKKITETKNIMKDGNGAMIENEMGTIKMPGDVLVSMNMWGFQADFIPLLRQGFIDFLSNKKTDLINDEYLLPIFIDQLLQEKRAEVKVIDTSERWFGVTYAEDSETVTEEFRKLAEQGVYAGDLYA